MSSEIDQSNYLGVILAQLETHPEERTDAQLKDLMAATSFLPFFVNLKRSKSFDVLTVQLEICKALRVYKVKANQPIIRAGSPKFIRSIR